MADPKSLRQVAAQQANAAKQRLVKRPEEMDEQVVPAEGAEASAQPVADAAPVAEASGGSTGSGPSYGLVGAGALGALGLIAAVAGGGGKSGGATPPVAEIPKPDQPKPQEPKPEEPKPVEPKPEEPKTEQPQPVEPKPEEPKTEQPQPVEPKPEEPKTEQPQPVEPKPEEPKTEQPQPVEPKPEEPKTEQPQPVEPKPEEPKSELPQPAEPKPEQPQPEQPKPELMPPALSLKVDSGSSNSDLVSNQAGVVVHGLMAGEVWRYSLDNGANWIVARDGQNEIPASAFNGSDGMRSAIVERFANGSFGAKAQINFELDTAAPNYPLEFRDLDGNVLRDPYSSNGRIDIRPFAARFKMTLQEGDVLNWACADNGSSIPSDIKFVSSPDEVLDVSSMKFSYGASAILFISVSDRAGNSGDVVAVNLLKDGFVAPPPPLVFLVEDNGVSNADKVTSNANIRVDGLPLNNRFKYSLDGGETWKTSLEYADMQTIAATEFNSAPGRRTVDVIRVNEYGKESPITHFEFTLQPEEILGSPAISTSGVNYTVFNGTNGLDHFVVKGSDGKGIHLVGYQQGDVIDLTQVLSVPAGSNILEKVDLHEVAGRPVLNVLTSQVYKNGNDLIGIELENFVLGTPVTVIYDGGKVIL